MPNSELCQCLLVFSDDQAPRREDRAGASCAWSPPQPPTSLSREGETEIESLHLRYGEFSVLTTLYNAAIGSGSI